MTTLNQAKESIYSNGFLPNSRTGTKSVKNIVKVNI